MKETENYQFELPEETDFYDVEVMNRNFKKLDQILKEISDKLNEE